MIKKSILFLLVFLLILLTGCHDRKISDKQTPLQGKSAAAESSVQDHSVQVDSSDETLSGLETSSSLEQDAVASGSNSAGQTTTVNKSASLTKGGEQDANKLEDSLSDVNLQFPQDPTVPDQLEELLSQKPDGRDDTSVISADTDAGVANIPLG